MSGGGGNTTSTVTQSNLPAYAQPYYESLMNSALAESKAPYQPYQGQRLAGESDATAQGLNMASNYANSSTQGVSDALNLTQNAANQAANLGNYTANGITNGYTAGTIDPNNVSFNGSTNGNVNSITSQNFDQNAASQYMSPYMQDVVNASKLSATNDYLQQQAMNNANFATSGAFGGSRAAVQNAIGQNNLMKNLSDIQVQGLQSAYENAQSQFNADQARQLQAAQSNQSTGLSVAQGNQQAGLTAQQANEEARQKQAQMDTAAQQATEQFRQSGAQLGLSGLQTAMQGADQMTNMQQAMDQMQLNRIKAQLGVGQTQENYRQQSLDQAYNDFVNQRDSQKQNLQFLSSILQGVPISANQDVTSTQGTNALAGALGSASGLQALYGLGNSS